MDDERKQLEAARDAAKRFVEQLDSAMPEGIESVYESLHSLQQEMEAMSALAVKLDDDAS